MKNNKGQALIEFVIILPILLLLILGAIDFGNILYKKYTLENDLDYVASLVRENKELEIANYSSNNNITSNIEKKDNKVTITVTKNVLVMTPGLNKILGKNYKIEAKRVIFDE